MATKANSVYPFGKFLKWLREQKGVSLVDVEKATGLSNAYLSQLETGARRRLPPPDRLRKLADYYNVNIKQLLEKAGYYEAKDIEETFEQKLEKAFLHAINDPRFTSGSRIKPSDLSTDAKRFIVEIYGHYIKRDLLKKPISK
jgi:transcriptional regulator with XRE-family HTH domain